MNLYSGRVFTVREVTRNRAHVELDNFKGVFELFIDQSWVLARGDDIALAAERDETGKYVAYAYENKTKEIRGWKNKEDQAAPMAICAFGGLFILIALIGFWPIAVFGGIMVIFGTNALATNSKINLKLAQAFELLGFPPNLQTESTSAEDNASRPTAGQPLGACPNCGATLALASMACRKCSAIFGPGSAWEIQPIKPSSSPAEPARRDG